MAFTLEPSRAQRLALASAAGGFGAGVLLSWPLWGDHAAAVPHVPVVPALTLAGAAASALPGALLIALLACLVPRWTRPAAVVAVSLTVWLVLGDLLRFQPWAWSHSLLLLALALAPRDGPRALHDARFVMGCVYLWSGLHKFNLEFAEVGFPWIFGPLDPGLGDGLAVVAWSGPVVEAALGAALLWGRWASLARWGLVGMHVLILAAVGPWGHDWNVVVWPWNLSMIALLLVLFAPAQDREAREVAGRSWRPAGALGWVLLVVCGLQPSLHLWGDGDAYPAFALYSYSGPSAMLIVPPDAVDALPDAARTVAVPREGGGPHQLGADLWLLEALGVPAYPAERVFRALHLGLTARPGAEGILLMIQTRERWADERVLRTWRAGEQQPTRHVLPVEG